MSTNSRRVAIIVGDDDATSAAITRALSTAGFDVATAGEAEPGSSAADLSNAAEREQFLARVRHQFGRLDVAVIVITNPVDTNPDFLDTTEGEFDRALSGVVKDPYFLTQLIARWMIDERSADADSKRSIIVVSPTEFRTGRDALGAHTIVRAGIAMLAQLWAHRLAEDGIAVFDVRAVVMPRGEADPEERAESLPCNYDDVALAVASLARGELHHASGSVIRVDGGDSLRRL